MNDPRELTDAELDIVGGGATRIMRPQPTTEPIVKLVEEIIVDVLKILEGNSGPAKKRAA